MKTEKDIKHWLEEIQDKGVNLTTWEEEFIESVIKQFIRFGKLSEKQEEIVERIYTDRVS